MFIRRAARFARSPAGRRLTREAVRFARKPENRQRIVDARRRVARKR